ncbi:MAG TPA: hypothetical protein VIU87_19095 [Mycobacterium sp.]
MKPPRIKHRDNCRNPQPRMAGDLKKLELWVDPDHRNRVGWICMTCGQEAFAKIVLPGADEEWTKFDFLAAHHLRVDKAEIPRLLVEIAYQMKPETLAWAVPAAWSWSDPPGLLLPQETWLSLWRRIGYTRDGITADRPSGPITLWRGAYPEWKRGLAWTDNRLIAEVFRWVADTPHGQQRTRYDGTIITVDGVQYGIGRTPVDPGKHVYVAEVPANALLAQIRWHESWEYIVDPTNLVEIKRDRT